MRGPYPDHPVRMLVGFAAGGPTDVIARIVAQKLSASLGQQFYVDDKPGAGGNIANAEVAKAAPDGYTLTVVSTGFMVNMSLYAHVPYDAVKDFAPITMVAYSPNVIVVNPSVPAKIVKELIELIKANPGKYSFAGPASARRRICRANCSSRNSASTWCTCRSPGAAHGDQLDHRRPYADRLHRAAAGAGQYQERKIARRSPCSRSSAARNCPTCRPCRKPAIPARRPTR